MRCAIVGAGGIGGFIAGALARVGHPVAVVARGAHLDAIRAYGLQVQSQLGSFTVRVDASDDLRKLGAFDALLLTFKAHQWPGLLEQLAPFAHTNTSIVTLQNGLPFWFSRIPPVASVDPGGRIGALFADSQIIGGVVHASGTILRAGVVRQSGRRYYPLCALTPATSPHLTQLVELFRHAGLKPEIDPQIHATLWLKLVNNAGLNPVSALTRFTLKRMLADVRARAHVRELMSEALAVGRVLGVVGDVDLDARIDVAAKLDDVKTSMLQDLEAHRPLELNPIVGAIVELGDRHGVAVDALRDAQLRLRAIEAEWTSTS